MLLARLKAFCFSLVFLGTMAPGLSANVISQELLSRDEQLKAVYLFNFTKYIVWPADQSDVGSSVITLCVNAPDAFADFLTQLARDKRVGQQRREVQISDIESAEGCEIVYLDAELPDSAPPLGDAVIVAESSAIYPPGPDIAFFLLDNKLRFEIDIENINQKRISVSSELLKLARVK